MREVPEVPEYSILVLRTALKIGQYIQIKRVGKAN